MINLYLKLIRQPDYYIEEEISAKEKYIDLNNLFWRHFIFNELYLECNTFSKQDIDIANGYIFNLKESKSFDKNLLFDSFNKISCYLNNLNKVLESDINFYYKTSINYLLFNKFLEWIVEKNKGLKTYIGKDIIWNFDISTLEEIYQVKYLIKFFKISFIKIYLGNYIEYSNKKDIENIIKSVLEKYKVEIIHNTFIRRKYYKLLGENYYYIPFFSGGCKWGKCLFCNIKTNHKYYVPQKGRKKRLQQIEEFIKENNIKYISIGDPSLEFTDLTYIANYFIKNNIKVRYQARSRFPINYSLTDFGLLRRSGLKYYAVGLESASSRLNLLMHKYPINISFSVFMKFALEADKFLLGPHYYTIFGFPTENRSEALLTTKLLLLLLKKTYFFSYTAGMLSFSPGSKLYELYKAYFIKKKATFNWINLTENSDNFYKNLMEFLNINLFKIDISKYKFINPFYFFQFMENSRLFHMIKLKYYKNPFYEKYD